MLHQLPIYLALVAYLLIIVVLSRKLRVAYPVALVIGGMLLSLLPVAGSVQLSPEVIFAIFLPPLLYEAAWYTSWKEFWKWRRVIFSFAFLIVLITSLLVAWVAVSIIPGFTLALGLLLGGIVSPPDAVSASAVLKHVTVPRRVVSIIEGESLLNDASSLVVFRYSLIAVSTGKFVFHEAATSFVWVIMAGVGIGVALGYVVYKLQRWLDTDVNSEIIITLITPYLIYLAAESVHASGVLSVVSGGLFLSSRSHLFLSHSSRLQGTNVWSVLGFLLNGLVFLLIGLELPVIVSGLGDTKMSTAIGYGIVISVILMLSRVVCALGASQFTVFVSRFIKTADNRPGWKGPLVFGWAGMRGVVSLAAALSIPVFTEDGLPFPQRNLILFVTFVVILITLVVQGLTLPSLIKWLNVEDLDHYPSRNEQEQVLRDKLYLASQDYLNAYRPDNDKASASLSLLKTQLNYRRVWKVDGDLLHSYREVYSDLLGMQRHWLLKWNASMELEEELVRHYLMLLDIEEEKLHHRSF